MERKQLLEVKNLYKIYKTSFGLTSIETVALKGVNLSIYKGDFIAILGPSGSGKTSLINSLSGLDIPSAGSITYFEGESQIKLNQLSEKDRDNFRLGRIAVVFQRENLIRSLSAKENVELSVKFLGIKDKTIIQAVFKTLGIEHRLNHKPDQLSGGEKQRVSLAKSLVISPMIIIADEPTGELDAETSEEVMDAFKKIHALGTTVIIVTHNPQVAQKAEIRYEMTDGHLRLTGQTITGNKITVLEDNVGRLRIPYSWISQMNVNDDLIGLKEISGQLMLVEPDQEDLLDFVSFDSQGRIRLPENLRKGEKYEWNIERQANSIYISPMEEK